MTATTVTATVVDLIKAAAANPDNYQDVLHNSKIGSAVIIEDVANKKSFVIVECDMNNVSEYAVTNTKSTIDIKIVQANQNLKK